MWWHHIWSLVFCSSRNSICRRDFWTGQLLFRIGLVVFAHEGVKVLQLDWFVCQCVCPSIRELISTTIDSLYFIFLHKIGFTHRSVHLKDDQKRIWILWRNLRCANIWLNFNDHWSYLLKFWTQDRVHSGLSLKTIRVGKQIRIYSQRFHHRNRYHLILQ